MTPPDQHSFAVLAYKESPYLEACIQSLFAQKSAGRIYISTSTPNDSITSLADKYKVPIKINSQKPGISTDWTFAYQQAETEYVTLAHQDDYYAPEYLERMLAIATKAKDNLITFCDYSELREEGEQVTNLNLLIKRALLIPHFLFSASISSTLLKHSLLSLGSPVSCPTVMYNKRNLGDDFAFSTEYSINLDWEAWLRFARRKGSFVYCNSRLVKHRVHSASETTAGIQGGIRQKEDLRLFAQVWPGFLAKQISRIYALSYLSNR